jgi:hypothetical protein
MSPPKQKDTYQMQEIENMHLSPEVEWLPLKTAEAKLLSLFSRI